MHAAFAIGIMLRNMIGSRQVPCLPRSGDRVGSLYRRMESQAVRFVPQVRMWTEVSAGTGTGKNGAPGFGPLACKNINCNKVVRRCGFVFGWIRNAAPSTNLLRGKLALYAGEVRHGEISVIDMTAVIVIIEKCRYTRPFLSRTSRLRLYHTATL